MHFKMEITLDSWGCYEVRMKKVIKYLWGMVGAVLAFPSLNPQDSPRR